MLFNILVMMLNILYLCPVFIVAAVQTLTIDSQLGTSIEDCFERISIGDQLPNSAIYRNVTELTTRECEQLCKLDKQCQTYDYGVGAKGNSTCNLSNISEKEIKLETKLIRHPDYDVYVRRFHCEQSPPTPIEPIFDEDGQLHRPAFPQNQKRPHADAPSDSESYHTGATDRRRPSSASQAYTYHINERPDDISHVKPELDRPPSYGDHSPPEIPYRPERPYRNHTFPKPDPYDVLHFQDPHGRPRPDPALLRPDPQYPSAPNNNDPGGYGPSTVRPNRPDPYLPEDKPEYYYITRPNRKPKPGNLEEIGYGSIQDKPKPDYGSYNQGHPNGPIGPPDRPYGSNYGYNSQYASAYGHNHGQSVQVEIYDHPSRYKPIHSGCTELCGDQYYAYGSEGGYDYGSSYSSLSSHQQTLNSHSQYYGGSADRPRPPKPDYGSESSGYGGSISQGSYESNSRPSYGSHQVAYGGSSDYSSSQASYGGSSQSTYGSDSRPSYYDDKKRPYSSSQVSYSGVSQSGYGGNSQSSYESNTRPSYDDKGSYSNSQASYGNDIDNGYGGNSQTSYHGSNSRPYDDKKGSYSSSQGAYGSENHSGYGGNSQPSYGNNNQPYDNKKGSYGSSQASYNSGSQSGYGGSSQSSYGSSYDDKKESYGSEKGTYGSESHSGYGGNSQSSYGSNSRPYEDKHGSNGGSQVSYGSANNGYSGGSQPSYGTNTRPYDDKTESYTNSKGAYGGESLSGYGGNSQSYGSNSQPYENNKGSYGSSQGSYQGQGAYGGSSESYYSNSRPQTNRPYYNDKKGSYGSDEDDKGQSGYGSRPTYGGNQDGYGSNQAYGSNQGSYTSSHSHSSNQEHYGSSEYYNYKPGPPNQAGYETDKHDSSGYGSNQEKGNQASYANENQAYGSQRPSNRPPYNQYGSAGSQNSGYSSNGYKDTHTPGYGNDRFDNHTNYGKPINSGYGSDYKPVYEYESDRPSGVPGYVVKPGGQGQVIISKPVSVSEARPGTNKAPGKPNSYEACFRRVLAGRRALRSHVRRAITCERLEDCRLECATEKRFPCESFNYRLDLSLRGKGLCELMTKPIEAFDLRRDFVDDKDYDFYELDRNSLEPNCPTTLRGPGLLHSGFLSSKPAINPRPGYNDKWMDRADYGSKYDHNRFYDDRTSSNYNRRYEDRFFVPYQIGQIGLSRSNEDDDTWDHYRGSYGGINTYYKDKNDYHKSINHWRLNSDIDTSRYYGVRPSYYTPNTNFNYSNLGRNDGYLQNKSYGYGTWRRDRWNASGTSNGLLDYEETSYYKPGRSQHYHGFAERSDFAERRDFDERRDEPVVVKDCSSRRRAGMSLGTASVRRALLTRNVVECESACFDETEFKCVSYSYRYSNSHGTDNCYLSERPYRGLDLSADSGSDVYAMPEDHGCPAISHKAWVESECFWHVRSGAGVSGAALKMALSVSGLGACEAECIRAQKFFCRGFSFRFDSPIIGDDLENCILTSTPPTSLDLGEGLRAVTGHELYARGNYGRGCEPALYDDVHHKETQCYLQYDKAAKLIGASVRGQARVSDEYACGSACTDAPFRCLSYSFSNNAPPDTDNCLLSEIRLFDLQRGVDYEHSADDWLFAFDVFNGQCWRKVHTRTYDEPTHELPRPLPIPVDPYPHPDFPSRLPAPEGSHYIHPPGAPGRPSYNPIRPSGPDPPVYQPGYSPSRPIYRPEAPEPRPQYPPGPVGPVYRPSYKPDYPNYVPPVHKPGYIPEQHEPGYRPSGPSGLGLKPAYLPGANRPEYRPGGGGPGYAEDNNGIEEPITVSWRHYTVSGFPCRKGSACAQNQVAGHWACEPEGGEIGSWDYCCAPSHRCGYSEGFHKPWCYVGPADDQWRPCSDKYYPYHQHNVPHPSLGNKDRPRPPPSRPYYNNRPGGFSDNDRPLQGSYAPDADRRYWDELYKNGPQAYYDKYGNPLPGYARVPTADRPYIKYSHNYPPSASGQWLPVSALHADEEDPQVPGGLGVPRYWPVAYLHKGPPPNMTHFRYNETKYTTTTTTERYNPSPKNNENSPPESRNAETDLPFNDDVKNKTRRDEKTRNLTYISQDELKLEIAKVLTTTSTSTTTTTSTTFKPESSASSNSSSSSSSSSESGEKKVQSDLKTEIKPETLKEDNETDFIKGITGKLDDFSGSIEVFDIEDAKKGEKSSELRTIEEEERQIEAIGRLLASKRNGKIVIEKRSQNELESKHIAVDKDALDFNFGNKFPIAERRGIVQRVSKEEIENDKSKNDKSLEVSETTFVRPPRVLSTTENIRKAIVNGKVFYDATIREQRDVYGNHTRRSRNFRPLEDKKGPSVISNASFGKKKVIHARNVSPVRRVRRVLRKRYNPEEVRKRLLEKEKNGKQDRRDTSKKT